MSDLSIVRVPRVGTVARTTEMIAEIHNLGTISANSGEAPEQRDATEIGRAPNTKCMSLGPI